MRRESWVRHEFGDPARGACISGGCAACCVNLARRVTRERGVAGGRGGLGLPGEFGRVMEVKGNKAWGSAPGGARCGARKLRYGKSRRVFRLAFAKKEDSRVFHSYFLCSLINLSMESQRLAFRLRLGSAALDLPGIQLMSSSAGRRGEREIRNSSASPLILFVPCRFLLNLPFALLYF